MIVVQVIENSHLKLGLVISSSFYYEHVILFFSAAAGKAKENTMNIWAYCYHNRE